MIIRLLPVAALLTIGLACDPTTPTGGDPDPDTDTTAPSDAPPCAEWAGEFGPLSVDLWDWNGQDVYVSSPDCCDQFTEVRSATTCEYLCASDGGFAGTGDGRCPTFYDEATQIETVWEQQ